MDRASHQRGFSVILQLSWTNPAWVLSSRAVGKSQTFRWLESCGRCRASSSLDFRCGVSVAIDAVSLACFRKAQLLDVMRSSGTLPS